MKIEVKAVILQPPKVKEVVFQCPACLYWNSAKVPFGKRAVGEKECWGCSALLGYKEEEKDAASSS